ncbi:DUF4870 domain-containing protein [Occallatibacter savannae]|uniref:DUF4870 domain-containing protein n=1 Tax=Occallatibacter savannae TaxID=1002691 RepID=UPI000D695526|nr:hypothetical protein [Occallatibacter savannae]
MDKPALSYKAAGAISYFTFLPAGVFLVVSPYKDDRNLRFHAWQSILLSMAAFASDIVVGAVALVTPLIGTAALAYSMRLMFLFWFVLWLACVIKAASGKAMRLPIIGRLAEKLSLK